MDKLVSKDGELMTTEEAEFLRLENELLGDDLEITNDIYSHTSSPAVASPLSDDTLSKMTLKQIIPLLLALSLKSYGSKKDLIARYKKHFAPPKIGEPSSSSRDSIFSKLDGVKGPNWTLNEDLRMLSILSDPAYMLIVRRLCEGVTIRFFLIDYLFNFFIN
jgi:hypothetical protein